MLSFQLIDWFSRYWLKCNQHRPVLTMNTALSPVLVKLSELTSLTLMVCGQRALIWHTYSIINTHHNWNDVNSNMIIQDHHQRTHENFCLLQEADAIAAHHINSTSIKVGGSFEQCKYFNLSFICLRIMHLINWDLDESMVDLVKPLALSAC